MAAKNRKISGGWPGLRGALGWLLAKTKTGLLAMGIQGAIVAVVFVASIIGVRAARREVTRLPEFSVFPARLRTEAPPWCAGSLGQVAFPREVYSIFDPQLTRDVAQAYLGSPWVKAVRRVAKRYPNELEIELDLRQPAAFVRLPDACHAIDADGIVLPLDYPKWDHELRPLPLIFGVKTSPPAPGQRWADAGTLAALSVLGVLSAEPALLKQVHFVDVSNLDGVIDSQRSEVLLFTRRRVRVAWGRPANTTKFGEPSIPCKLARLRRYLSRPAALSDGASSIDLRFPEDDEVMAQRPE